tara:strand:+ start:45226 stop:45975 length:750 start_codon:yes stop_codon:yes gene_type:complete
MIRPQVIGTKQPHGDRSSESGMLLVEALVAMAIVAMVTIAYIGIRTDALIDATRARNWRLAREIAEEKLSGLMAGAHEMQPESGQPIEIEKYEDFSYKIVLGESAVADIEAEVANEAAGEDSEAKDQIQWQQDRRDMRRAQDRGLDAMEYEEQQELDDIEERLAEKAPSEEDFEEVAVVVYFPKLDADFPGQKEALLIKARISTLAISGLTPDQASSLAESQSGGTDPANPASNPAGGAAAGLPGGGGR